MERYSNRRTNSSTLSMFLSGARFQGRDNEFVIVNYCSACVQARGMLTRRTTVTRRITVTPANWILLVASSLFCEGITCLRLTRQGIISGDHFWRSPWK